MGTPPRDGFASGHFHGTSSGTMALTTSLTNDIIWVIVGNESTSGSTATVSSITAAGLTFTKRTNGQKQVTNGSAPCNVEIWWALASSALSGLTITVTLTGSVDACAFAAIAVNGAHNLSNPFDSNAGLPVFTSSTSSSVSAATPTFSTSQAHDYGIFFSFQQATNGVWTIGSGLFSAGNFLDVQEAGGTNYAVLQFHDASLTSTQSGASPGSVSGAADIAIYGIDFITGDASSSTETGTAVLAFGPVAFVASGLSINEAGAAKLAFGPVAINATGFDVGVPGSGLRQFWTL